MQNLSIIATALFLRPLSRSTQSRNLLSQYSTACIPACHSWFWHGTMLPLRPTRSHPNGTARKPHHHAYHSPPDNHHSAQDLAPPRTSKHTAVRLPGHGSAGHTCRYPRRTQEKRQRQQQPNHQCEERQCARQIFWELFGREYKSARPAPVPRVQRPPRCRRLPGIHPPLDCLRQTAAADPHTTAACPATATHHVLAA